MNTENIIKELNPIDYFIETKKITLLFAENKILILNDLDNLPDKIMYSFFIERKLIASNYGDENLLISKFKKYLYED